MIDFPTTSPADKEAPTTRRVRHDASGTVYPSIEAASRATGVRRMGILRSLRNGWMAGGSTWSDASVALPVDPVSLTSTPLRAQAFAARKVQREACGTVFDSVKEAARVTGTCASDIRRAIKNGTKPGGSRWSEFGKPYVERPTREQPAAKAKGKPERVVRSAKVVAEAEPRLTKAQQVDELLRAGEASRKPRGVASVGRPIVRVECGTVYPSVAAAVAAFNLNASSLRKAIRRQYRCAGSLWHDVKPRAAASNSAKQPVQREECGTVYPSIQAAAIATGLPRKDIRRAIRDGIAAGGSRWGRQGEPYAPLRRHRNGERRVRRRGSYKVYPSQAAAARSVGRTQSSLFLGMKTGTRCAGFIWEEVRRRRRKVTRTPEQLNALIAHYMPRVRKIAAVFARRFRGHEITSFDDAFTDGLGGLHKALTREFRTEGPATFDTWVGRWIEKAMLAGITERRKNEAAARRAGVKFNVSSFSRFEGRSDDFDFAQTVRDEKPDGVQRLEADEAFARLVAGLPDADRRVVELRFVHDYTAEEIAAQRGEPAHAIERRLARALSQIRRRQLAA